MITVTFTAATLFQGSMRSIGSTLSVTETDARVLVDIGVATAPGVTPQGGWPTGELSDTFLAKADNLSGLGSSSTARTNLGLGGLATLNDAPSDGSEYVRKNAAWSIATGGGGGGGGVNIQTFGSSTTSGTFTWTKPAGAKMVEIYLWAGGGGGGSGDVRATTAARGGGGGGAGGGFYHNKISASYLSSTESVVVGAGGAGGASITTNGYGNGGAAGGTTTFSVYRALGGPGANMAGAGGAQRTSFDGIISVAYGGGPNATVTATGGTPGQRSGEATLPSGGGSAGGAAANVTTSSTGGSGGSFTVGTSHSGIFTAISGGSGGTTAGVSATNGNSATTESIRAGTGGGAGFYISGTGNGTNNAGGNGGWPGGGGGGGGCVDLGLGLTSGAGGKGANGFAVIITYF